MRAISEAKVAMMIRPARAENLVHGRADHAFGGGPAGAFGVGRIGQQNIHAA